MSYLGQTDYSTMSDEEFEAELAKIDSGVSDAASSSGEETYGIEPWQQGGAPEYVLPDNWDTMTSNEKNQWLQDQARNKSSPAPSDQATLPAKAGMPWLLIGGVAVAAMFLLKKMKKKV